MECKTTRRQVESRGGGGGNKMHGATYLPFSAFHHPPSKQDKRRGGSSSSVDMQVQDDGQNKRCPSDRHGRSEARQWVLKPLQIVFIDGVPALLSYWTYINVFILNHEFQFAPHSNLCLPTVAAAVHSRVCCPQLPCHLTAFETSEPVTGFPASPRPMEIGLIWSLVGLWGELPAREATAITGSWDDGDKTGSTYFELK